MGSQKRFVLISVIGIVAIIGGLSYFTYRMVRGTRVGSVFVTERAQDSTSAQNLVAVDSDIDLSGVTQVRVRGGWNVELRQSSEASMRVSATESHVERVIIEREDETLILRIADNTNYVRARFEAIIGLPQIAQVEVLGLADVTLDGIVAESFSVRVDGAANVVATRSSFENLDLALAGAGNIDFESSPATNAVVSVAGLANVAILMNGGVLEGSVEGLGRVSYSGSVSEQRIDVDGGFLRAIDADDKE
jgi:hypothetical protein